MFGAGKLDVADSETEQIIALSGRESGDLLDMCCGPGRHSLAFTQRGFRVTGVDATPFLLDKARDQAEREGADVEWVESDMREFVRPESYDLALSLFTSFGFFEEAADNRAVLEHICQSLRPGGTLVLDVLGKEVLARKFQASAVHRRARPVTSSFSGGKSSMTGPESRRTGSSSATRGCAAFASSCGSIRGMSSARCCSRLASTRLSCMATFWASAYGPEASRLVAVASRAG